MNTTGGRYRSLSILHYRVAKLVAPWGVCLLTLGRVLIPRFAEMSVCFHNERRWNDAEMTRRREWLPIEQQTGTRGDF